ncbi:hypothetical protein Tco_0850245 [Tanacetum coccineum]
MPPRRASVSKRALVARRAPSARTANNPARNASTTNDAPISVDAINQLIETRVAEALANQELLRNSSVNGDGTERVVGLTLWFEKMESVFYISNYTIENQVCYLHSSWCNFNRGWRLQFPKTLGIHDAVSLRHLTLGKLS